MPFDSNGVFSRVMNWTSDQQNGIAIECGRHDAEDDNFAQGFNDCFCRDGRAAATGDFNLGNYKLKNVANGTATTDAVNKGQLDSVNSALVASTVNLTGTQTISGSKTFTGNVSLPYGTLLTKQDGEMEGGQINFEKPTNSSLTGNVFIDIYENQMRFVGKNSSQNATIPLTLDLETNVAMAPASDYANTIVTTTGISKSGNGFVKLGNGIIIQWGRYPSYVSPDPQRVTFPTPFTSTNYKAVCTYFRTGGDVDSGKDHINVDTQFTTGFTFRMSDTAAYGVNWIAIGY